VSARPALCEVAIEATDRCLNLVQVHCIERMHNRAKCELSARRLKWSVNEEKKAVAFLVGPWLLGITSPISETPPSAGLARQGRPKGGAVAELRGSAYGVAGQWRAGPRSVHMLAFNFRLFLPSDIVRAGWCSAHRAASVPNRTWLSRELARPSARLGRVARSLSHPFNSTTRPESSASLSSLLTLMMSISGQEVRWPPGSRQASRSLTA
jgi:hypothetical protein